MTKAEQRALELIPILQDDSREERRVAMRTIYINGYEQAEKDLELTWEDIAHINQLHFEVLSEVNSEEILPHKIHQEVLRRFNEQRNKVTMAKEEKKELLLKDFCARLPYKS